MADNKTLIYCTNGYPSDVYSEKEFVDGELTALRRYFDRIILLPCDDAGRKLGFSQTLPAGVEVDWSLTQDRRTHSRLIKLFYIFHPYVARALIDVTREARTLSQWCKGFMEAANTITIGRVLKSLLRRNGLSPDNTVIYSIWFLNSAAAAARLGISGNWKVATRAHTTDMYNTKRLFRSVEVRRRLLNGMSKVISISYHGRDWLCNMYPGNSDRFTAIHLGSIRKFPLGEYKPSDGIESPLQLVTVARITDYKRLTLIIDVLEAVARLVPERHLKWTHIGDGDYRVEELYERGRTVKTPNLEINFAGMRPNTEIQRMYHDNPPHWHILMSSTEGIPVGMGEAMSYGIPSITTEAGQTSELADCENSIIFPIDIDVEHCAGILAEHIFDTSLQKRMGEAALKKWELTFNSETLANQTAATLANLL